MTANVHCRRCRQQRPGLAAPPFPDQLGSEILEHTCDPCWQEWQENEVKVINELRLNFMDPESDHILRRHLREFLSLDPAADGPSE